MNYEFLPDADTEFREASRYYESEAPGVGMAFISEVYRTISVILDYPRSAQKYRNSIRGKVLAHFPYTVLYSIASDVLVIIAVAHHKRRPTYWRYCLSQARGNAT